MLFVFVYHVIHALPVLYLPFSDTLGRPPGLKVKLSTDEKSLNISWTFPYTLTGVDILNFLINISSNMTSNGSNLSLPYTRKVNGSTTSIQHSVSTSCAVHFVSVQAETLAGLGEASSANQSIFGRGIYMHIMHKHIFEYLYIITMCTCSQF